MESVYVALITAVATIVAAGIQSRSARDHNAVKQQAQLHFPSGLSAAVGQVASRAPFHVWLWVGGALLLTNAGWFLAFPVQGPYIVHLGALPWATVLLALLRPIRAGYAGAMVTAISLASLLIFYATGGYYLTEELPILALVFTGNAVLVSAIAYLRGRSIASA